MFFKNLSIVALAALVLIENTDGFGEKGELNKFDLFENSSSKLHIIKTKLERQRCWIVPGKWSNEVSPTMEMMSQLSPR